MRKNPTYSPTTIFNLNEVQYAIVETTGKINFFRKDEGKSDPPGVIIKDGLLIEEGLVKAGLGKNWLSDVLKRRNAELKSVFLLTACGDGSYTLILKEGKSK